MKTKLSNEDLTELFTALNEGDRNIFSLSFVLERIKFILGAK